jgi:hypothetical protein
MTGPSFAGRYWRSLTASWAPAEQLAEGRRGYSFWQRYWASFIGAVLPMAKEAEHAPSIARFSSPSWPIRTMPKASLGLDGWLSLPEIDGPAILQASGESRVIAEAATPDGKAEFYVRRNGTSRKYLLEVVLRDFHDLPAIVLVRYSTAHGEQVLVIPLVSSEVGVPSAQVELVEIDATQRWIARGPFPANQVAVWDRDTVAASIAAAASGATREAWRRMSKSLTPDLRRMVEEALP